MSEWESEPLISETDDQDQAESLLLSAQSQSRFLFAFNHADIAALAQHLSILSFDAGELIMQRGQLATWVGILLSGELSAIIGDSVVGTTRPDQRSPRWRTSVAPLAEADSRAYVPLSTAPSPALARRRG